MKVRRLRRPLRAADRRLLSPGDALLEPMTVSSSCSLVEEED
jgi:hypothetical protein